MVRVYASLLDEFGRYQRGVSTKENLLNKINRIRDFDDETFSRMQRGTRFEKAVLKDAPHEFDAAIVNAVRALLPKNYATQYAVSFIDRKTLFYGYADVVGDRRVIDIKTTANFNPEKYRNSFQNLYLYALKNQGAEKMEYIVYDFKTLHHLVYTFQEIDFSFFLNNMNAFMEFLELNRNHITDTKIFMPDNELPLF